MADSASDLPDFDELWDYNQPDETEKRFRELLPQAESHPAYHVELLTQIARTQGLQREFDSAHHTLDQIKSMLRQEMKRACARYMLERGRVYNSSGQKSLALPLFQEAWKVARENNEPELAVDAAHMLAIVAPPEEALDWNLRALGLAENSQEPRARRWLGSLYNNIGWTYHDLEEYPRALEYFEQALSWREEQGQETETRIARWCVARCLRSLERVEEAYQIQQDLLAEYRALDEASGYVYEEHGECLLLLKRPEEARPYFHTAYEILSNEPWLVGAEPERLERLRRLGSSSEQPF